MHKNLGKLDTGIRGHWVCDFTMTKIEQISCVVCHCGSMIYWGGDRIVCSECGREFDLALVEREGNSEPHTPDTIVALPGETAYTVIGRTIVSELPGLPAVNEDYPFGDVWNDPKEDIRFVILELR